MRFVHTYWTKPAFADRWNVNKLPQLISNIWYYTTSVAYLKKLGQYIELHTDDFGKQCLDHIPYDNIYTDLNTIPENIKPFMWAYGKFWGCKDLDLGYIHIDGDVFIKSQKVLDAIGYGHKVLIQGHEYVVDKKYVGPIYEKTAVALKTLQYPGWSDHNGQNAYNVGILQFNDKELKDLYFNTYFEYADKCCADKTISTLCSESNGHLAPDLIFEQQWLYEMCKYKNIEAKTLLHPVIVPDGKGMYNNLSFIDSANAIGYQHIIGWDKYKEHIIYKCKMTLKNLDPNLYESALRKIAYIKTLI